MELSAEKIHQSIGKWVYENYPSDEISTIYVSEPVSIETPPQIHRMYLTEVAVLYYFGFDGFRKGAYQIPFREALTDDIDELGSLHMAEFVDKCVEWLGEARDDSEPIQVSFEGDQTLLTAVENKLLSDDPKEIEIKYES